MAEPTYTVQLDCTQCGEEITMAGVPFPGTSRTVTVRWACRECGATGDEVVERRKIPGQPGYGGARLPRKTPLLSVTSKPETVFGTSPGRIESTAPLTAPSRTATDDDPTEVVCNRCGDPMARDGWHDDGRGLDPRFTCHRCDVSVFVRIV